MVLPPAARKKWLTALTCLAGVTAVAWGMALPHHPLFLAGIGLVIAGYLLLRRELKQAAGKSREGRNIENPCDHR